MNVCYFLTSLVPGIWSVQKIKLHPYCYCLVISVTFMIRIRKNGGGWVIIHLWHGSVTERTSSSPLDPSLPWNWRCSCPPIHFTVTPRWWLWIATKGPELFLSNSCLWTCSLRPWWFWDAWNPMDKWIRKGFTPVHIIGDLLGRRTLGIWWTNPLLWAECSSPLLNLHVVMVFGSGSLGGA